MVFSYGVPTIWIFDKPASMMFCVYLWRRYERVVKPNTVWSQYYPFHWIWRVYSSCWIAAYFFAAIFHTVENSHTEKGDYFSCHVTLCFQAMCSIIRAFHLKDWKSVVLFTSPITMFFVYYIYYMLAVQFDYGWHVVTGMYLCCIHMFLLMQYYVRRDIATASYCSKRKLSKSTMWYIITITILFLGAPLELYEFPPLFGHFDGHSLWHLAGGIISVAFHLHTVADAADYIDEYAYAKLH